MLLLRILNSKAHQAKAQWIKSLPDIRVLDINLQLKLNLDKSHKLICMFISVKEQLSKCTVLTIYNTCPPIHVSLLITVSYNDFLNIVFSASVLIMCCCVCMSECEAIIIIPTYLMCWIPLCFTCLRLKAQCMVNENNKSINKQARGGWLGFFCPDIGQMIPKYTNEIYITLSLTHLPLSVSHAVHFLQVYSPVQTSACYRNKNKTTTVCCCCSEKGCIQLPVSLSGLE